MVTYMSEGIFGQMAQAGWADQAICAGCVEPNTLYYLAANSMYLIVPALMVVRMWRDAPFGILESGAKTPSLEPQAEPLVVDLRADEPAIEIGDLNRVEERSPVQD